MSAASASTESIFVIMDKYGSDALRLYLLDSKVVKADSLRFQEAGVKIVKKNVLIMIENMLQYRRETVEFFEHQSGKTYEILRILGYPDTGIRGNTATVLQVEHADRADSVSVKVEEIEREIKLEETCNYAQRTQRQTDKVEYLNF